MAVVSELWVLLQKGGFVMPPLVLCMMLLWFGLGYRFVLLYLGDRRSVRALVDAAASGALTVPRGVVARAAMDGVQVARKFQENLRYHLDEAFFKYESELGSYASLCDSVVRAAPLLGLLGTVAGMIETFDHLGDTSGVNQAGGVAGGISEALFSTQMGLLVAIPGLLLGRMLARRQKIVADELQRMREYISGEYQPVEV